jgi:hypothetical protein
MARPKSKKNATSKDGSGSSGSDFYTALAAVLGGGDQVDHVAAFNALAKTNGWPIRFEYAESFRQEALNRLLAVWKAKAEGAVPDRSMFDAKTLKQFLPNVTIIEREHIDGSVSYRFRLIGTEIVRLFGEGTGERLEDTVPPSFVERWSSAYEAVLKARRPLRVETHFELPQVSYLDGETFFAPLRTKSGEIELILAATYFSARTGVTPELALA